MQRITDPVSWEKAWLVIGQMYFTMGEDKPNANGLRSSNKQRLVIGSSRLFEKYRCLRLRIKDAWN
jgi:hypothetical protein